MSNEAEWKTITLAGVAEKSPTSFVDGPFGSNLKSSEYSSEGVRLIQLQNIGDGYWIDENQKFIPVQKFKELQRHGAIPGDITIAKMAEPVARACLLPPVSDQFIVVADCIKLTVDKENYDSRYLVYAINDLQVRRQAIAKSIGTTRQRINLSLLKTIILRIPCLPEQRRIAEILDTVDNTIQQTEQLIAKLKQVKIGLLHDLLTRGLDENGELRDPVAHPETFKDSAYGKIPLDWEVLSLGQLCMQEGGSIQTGPFGSQLHARDYQKEGKPIITVEHLGENKILHNNLPLVGERDYIRLRKYTLKKGDLVFSRVGAIDRCSLVTSHEENWLFSGRCLRVRVSEKNIRSSFLSYQLNTHPRRQWIMNHAVGSTMACLNTSILSHVPIILPCMEEQEKIVFILDSYTDRIVSEETYLAKLRQIKKGLMRDLLTGKVRISDTEAALS